MPLAPKPETSVPPLPVESTARPGPPQVPHDRDSYVAPTYVTVAGFGNEQLTVIADGADPPSQGQWIFKSEVAPTQAMLEGILNGTGNVCIDETTEGWLFGLFAKECPGFKGAIEKDLRYLARTPLGRQLLQEITNRDQKVVIRPTTSDKGGLVKPDSESKARKAGQTPGAGSGSTVLIPVDLRDDTFVVYRKPPPVFERGKMVIPEIPSENEEIPQPRFMTLAHELVHVHRGQRGLIEPKGSHRRDGYLNQEEFQTINGDYKFTENKIRRSFGLQARFGHFHHRTSMKP
ncbi:MAG: M91 family zinc metallopeptidase [Myxococcota bacterium]|nr:M91 family zinc metallopeptidase [Myxococcota bacterium]